MWLQVIITMFIFNCPQMYKLLLLFDNKIYVTVEFRLTNICADVNK